MLVDTEYDQLSGELARLNRLLDRAQARFSAQFGDGLERAAFVLLVHLVKDGPRRLSALAEAVHSDISTVSRQVTQLVQLVLVARQPDPSDGRASLLAATDEGRATFEAKRARRNQNMAKVLAEWTPADRATLCRLLGRFNDDYENHHLRGTPR
ncbi:MAG: MarR family transcriptional regulator [Pseudonocardiales bacterium]|nr:MarR family transcriptional regulator [Pseudonocardiales bacterium]